MAEEAVTGRGPLPGSASPTKPRPARDAWPDAAKAACILLVVLGHVTYIQLDLAGPRWAAGAPPVWEYVDVPLHPLRMPLFFAISGYFSVSALARPWRSSVRQRVGQNLYLHVLWLLIAFMLSTAVAVPTFMAPERLREVPQAVLTASTGLWYLYALAGYFVIAKATRSLPAAVPLSVALLLAVLSFADALPGAGDTQSVYQNLVWFLAGARLPALVRSLSARSRPRLLLTATPVVLVVIAADRLLHPSVPVQAVLEIPIRAAAVVLGICLAVLLTERRPVLSAPLLWLGRRTLPVYVVHGVVLLLIERPAAALTQWAFGEWSPLAVDVVIVLYPLLLTAAVVAVCLLLHRLATEARGGWLFALPGGARSRVRPAP